MNINTSRYTFDSDTTIGPDVDLDAEQYTSITGEPITEESTEAFTVGRGGRPSLGRSGASPQIAFRIPKDLRDRAEQIAREEGRTLSAIAREQLERYIDSHAA